MALRGPRLDPGLDRHPDALQHPARLPPDAARAARTRTSTTYVERTTPPTGFWGNMRRLHGQPAEGLVGRRGDRRQRLLLRLPAAAHRRPLAPTRRSLDMLDGKVQGLLPARREPGRRLGQRAAAAARPGQARLAGRARPRRDRERRVLEGRPGDRDRRAAHRGHRHRGVLPAGRRAHREGRHVHQHPAAAAVAPQGGRAAGRLPLATCGSSTTSAACIREKLAGSTDATDRPLLDLTWDYPTEGAASTTRAPRRCCARSTAGTPTAGRCRPTPS